MHNLTAAVEGRMESPPRIGDLLIGEVRIDGRSWSYWAVISVMPILTKGSATQKNVEVKVEGYCLGLKRSSPPI